MSISLSDYETGAKYDGDYSDDLAALEDRLERLQAAHIIHGQRSVIMFEGWDAAGKGGIIRRLTASLDPRFFEVWPISAPNDEEKARHFLWRFRSEEHTSELQSLMRISYAVFCLKKKNTLRRHTSMQRHMKHKTSNTLLTHTHTINTT